ncbi:MAG: CBS domain-containing protein, partial [Saprospiraceae bacterium]|nr:CBS domain-containing protein [Saprospiraceae bacterium]
RHMNGARWMLRGYTQLRKEIDKDEAVTIITAKTLRNQLAEKPIHEWELPSLSDLKSYRPSTLTVGESMTTDLFTVRKEDIIELVGEMMDWKHIRYMPVEDEKAKLVGLVTHRLIIRELIKRRKEGVASGISVADIMIANPLSIKPEATVKEAMKMMRTHMIGCLPVINDDDELVGIITEMDFLRVTARLLDRLEEASRED